MATDSTKIMVGAGTVSIGAYVAAGGAGTLTDVGHTKSPVTVTPRMTMFDVKSERAFGTIKQVPQDMEIDIKVPMLEVTAENMRVAFRQPTGNKSGSGSNLTLLIGDPKEQYHQMQVVGPGPGSTSTRTITWWRTAIKELAEIPFAKGDTSVYDVTFSALYDDSVATADKFGKQVDS